MSLRPEYNRKQDETFDEYRDRVLKVPHEGALIRAEKIMLNTLVVVTHPYWVEPSPEYEHADAYSIVEDPKWAPLEWCRDRFKVDNLCMRNKDGTRQYNPTLPYVAFWRGAIRFKDQQDATLCKMLWG